MLASFFCCDYNEVYFIIIYTMAKNRYFFGSVGQTIHAEPHPIQFKSNVYVAKTDYEATQLTNAGDVQELTREQLKEKVKSGAIDLPTEVLLDLEKNEGDVKEGDMIAHTVTEEDVENHPDLEGKNIHKGDTIHVPNEMSKVEKENIAVGEDGKPRDTEEKKNTAKKGRPASK